MTTRSTRRPKARSQALAALLAVAALTASACGQATDADSASTDAGAASTDAGAASTDAGAASTDAGAGDTKGTDIAEAAVLNKDVDNSKPVRIAWFTPSAQNAYVATVGEGLQTAADARNATLTSFDSGFDPAVQYTQIEDALASGQFDAFIITPVDSMGVAPAVKAAAEAGIAVVCGGSYPCGDDWVGTVSNMPGVVAQSLVTEASLGENTGKLIVEACADASPCKVAQIPGAASIPAEQALFEGLQSVISTNPAIEVVARADGGYQPAPAEAATQDFLQAHPDLNVIAASSDAMAAGVALAVEAAGLQDQVKIIGLAGSQLGVDSVSEGKWFGTVMMYPFDEGLYLVDQAVSAVRGQPFEAGIDTAKKQVDYPPVFTQDNASEFDGYVPQWLG